MSIMLSARVRGIPAIATPRQNLLNYLVLHIKYRVSVVRSIGTTDSGCMCMCVCVCVCVCMFVCVCLGGHVFVCVFVGFSTMKV